MAINSLSTGWRPGVCTSSTRPTAPYEGQVIYETDTDLSYVWGGAAWQQVSGGTAVGNSGLVYITSATVGSGSASVSVSNCFTSTYDNYKIIWTGGVSVGAEALSLNLLPTSVTGWNTSYYQHIAYNTYSAGVVGLYSNNAAKWTYVGEITTANKTNINFELFAPNLAQYTALSNNYHGGGGAGSGAGLHQIASAFTGFTISGASNFSGGTITVYGYRKA